MGATPNEAEKTAVYVATTNGPARVVGLSAEDPDITSVMCWAGASEPLPVWKAYHDFVSRKTGFVARMTGCETYRADLSEPVTHGDSWGLGMLIAHALHASGRLALGDEPAARVVWASGRVTHRLDSAGGGERMIGVNAVDAVPAKLEAARGLFADCRARGAELTIALPAANDGRDLRKTIYGLNDRARVNAYDEIGLETFWRDWSGGADGQTTRRALDGRKAAGLAAVVALIAFAAAALGGRTDPTADEPETATTETSLRIAATATLRALSDPSLNCFEHGETSVLAVAPATGPAPTFATICGGGRVEAANEGAETVDARLEATPSGRLLTRGRGRNARASIAPGERVERGWSRALRRGEGAQLVVRTADGAQQRFEIVAPAVEIAPATAD
ncbi:MAG: hypothetical protein ACFB00_10320 [Parvularculaceae bacterium]